MTNRIVIAGVRPAKRHGVWDARSHAPEIRRYWMLNQPCAIRNPVGNRFRLCQSRFGARLLTGPLRSFRSLDQSGVFQQFLLEFRNTVERLFRGDLPGDRTCRILPAAVSRSSKKSGTCPDIALPVDHFDMGAVPRDAGHYILASP